MNVYSHIITSFSSADQFWRWAPTSCNHLKQVFSVPLAFYNNNHLDKRIAGRSKWKSVFLKYSCTESKIFVSSNTIL